MRLKLDIHEESAVRVFSEQVVNAHEPLSVEVVPVPVCPNRIVPIIALADIYRRKGGDITFFFQQGTPADVAFSGFCSPSMNPDSGIGRPFGRVWRFDNGDELNRIVTACELELNRTVRLAKGVRLCFSWCLNEIMDNVLTHSVREGKAFGYVMVQYVPEGNLLKASVFDAGMGLKASFAGSKYTPQTSAEAIRLAVMRNVTSGNGQGNGLYGLKRLVGQSPDGRLHIRSAGAEYLYDPSRNLESVRDCWMFAGYPGTTGIDFQIRCDGELSFSEVFPEAVGLADLWAEHRESEDGHVYVKISDVVNGCGSRSAGREVRTLVENLVEADRRKVVIDFCGMENCSSGFVDELLGKLLEKYGFVAFSQAISFVNVRGVVALLINHSIAQRMAAIGMTSDSRDGV